MSLPHSTEQDLTQRGDWTSASSAEADALCPGRHLAQRGLPDPRSADSTFGDQVHKAWASGDMTGLSTEQESITDSLITIEAKLVSEYFPNAVGWDGKPFNREGRLWISWEDGLKHSGQADVTYVVGTKALIIDGKALPGDKPASSKNMQLRDLATLLKHALPWLSEIAVAIAQPLVTHSPQLCLYTEEDLKRSARDLYYRVKASNSETSPVIAGDIQCKFCRARTSCEAYHAFASQSVPAIANGSGIAEIPFARWTPSMRTVFMDRVGIAQTWLEECKDQLREMLKADPNSVPGYHLTPGKIKYPIINPEIVYDRFHDAGGSLPEFMKAVGISKTNLKEQVKLATGKKGQALDKLVEDIIGDNHETKQDRESITKIKQ